MKADGLYRIDLANAAGTLVTASPQYTIDVLDDEAPSVSFSKPGRDLRATSVDEIFVEAAAEDDYGVKQLDLVYAVNGGPERQREAHRRRAPRRAPRSSAGHTFFLEELGLQPGDVVSYYARATDNDEVSGAKSVTSDIFFLQIQPFRKDYRAAESQAGGQQGGQQGGGQRSVGAVRAAAPDRVGHVQHRARPREGGRGQVPPGRRLPGADAGAAARAGRGARRRRSRRASARRTRR